MRAIIDGTETPDDQAVISVYDWGLVRGFGAFEVIRAYRGRPFRLGAHLDRLERSLAALGMAEPDRPSLEEWCNRAAEAGGNCLVRVIMTWGSRDPRYPAPPRTIVTWEDLAEPSDGRLALLPMTAPWHPASAEAGFPGVKWLSYAPNMLSTDIAQRAGYDDALLVSGDGWVLEGPTFTVAWIMEGALETPGMEMGILASITRDVLREIAARLELPVREDRFRLDRLEAADEVIALSTSKEVAPVVRLGQADLRTGPMAARFLATYREIVSEELD
jgi:branched-subunit amino acid aminotransferase/4-amino-4-deoxychorismate lyase